MNQNSNQTPNFYNYQPPKYDFRYYLKCVLAILCIIIGLCSILFSGLILCGLMQIAAAILLFPPTVEALQKATKSQLNRAIRYPVILLLFFTSFVIIIISRGHDATNDNSAANTNSIYHEYLCQQAEVIKNLPSQKLERRTKAIGELQANPLYERYSNEISAQYLPVLNALGEAIRGRDDSTYYLSDVTENALNKQQRDIVINQMKLIFSGGFTEDMLSVFDKYKDKFGYYGLAGSTGYSMDGKQTDSIRANYNLTPIFIEFDPNNKKLANSIYEVVSKGIVTWGGIDGRNFTYPYLFNKKDYNNYLKQVDPDSPYILNYDYELTSDELWRSYDDNEVAADNKYKNKSIAVTGTIEKIAKDVMDKPYILLSTNDLGAIQCSFEKDNTVANLLRGQNVTIIGTCSGKIMSLVEMSDCKIY